MLATQTGSTYLDNIIKKHDFIIVLVTIKIIIIIITTL
jgi:hypothetical protein